MHNNTGEDMKLKYYINNFMIYSIFGYIMETIMKTFIKPVMNNGSMYGPWVPIYGFGVCLIIMIERFIFNRVKTNRFIKILLVFIISTILLTTLEYIGGNLLECLTGKIYWDYSKLKFNYGHYIAFEISLIWGISSLIIIYILKPIIDKLIKKIPTLITYLIFLTFIIDLIISIISKLDIN